MTLSAPEADPPSPVINANANPQIRLSVDIIDYVFDVFLDDLGNAATQCFGLSAGGAAMGVTQFGGSLYQASGSQTGFCTLPNPLQTLFVRVRAISTRPDLRDLYPRGQRLTSEALKRPGGWAAAKQDHEFFRAKNAEDAPHAVNARVFVNDPMHPRVIAASRGNSTRRGVIMRRDQKNNPRWGVA